MSANLRTSSTSGSTTCENRAKNMTHEQAAKQMQISPRTVEEMSVIKESAQPAVIEKIKNGEMSVNAASKIVKERRVKNDEILDATGYPIPKELHELWQRRNETLAMMRTIAEMKNKLMECKKKDDPLFTPAIYTDCVSWLMSIHQELKTSQLHAVCSTCQGRGRKACKHCGGRGFLSAMHWEMVSNEVKKIRGGR